MSLQLQLQGAIICFSRFCNTTKSRSIFPRKLLVQVNRELLPVQIATEPYSLASDTSYAKLNLLINLLNYSFKGSCGFLTVSKYKTCIRMDFTHKHRIGENFSRIFVSLNK
jgi:hypothetical protein